MARAKLQTVEVTQEEAAAAAFRRQVRFWIVAVVLALAGLATLKLR